MARDRWVLAGTVTWTVIIIGRFAGDRLIEDWVELDRLGLFQQIGCIPTGS
jgi:fucose permease